MDPLIAVADGIWVAAIASIPGLLAAIVAWRAGRRRANSDELIRMRDRIDELEEDLHDVRAAQEECARDRRQLMRENLDLYRENSDLRRKAG